MDKHFIIFYITYNRLAVKKQNLQCRPMGYLNPRLRLLLVVVVIVVMVVFVDVMMFVPLDDD